MLRQLFHWLFFGDGQYQDIHWPGMDIYAGAGVNLHLVGSMHMGLSPMMPLPEKLQDKLSCASGLIVEADVVNGIVSFDNVPDCAPLIERLDGVLYQQVMQRAVQSGVALEMLQYKPAWLVGMILQGHQAQRLGFHMQYGIDYQLLQAAHYQKIPVTELEGCDGQIALLMQLPDEGVQVLRDALRYWHENARLLQLMANWWISGLSVNQPVSLPGLFDQELHDVLLRQRNQRWNQLLRTLPAGDYVVVVGALHLYAADNLPELLAMR